LSIILAKRPESGLPQDLPLGDGKNVADFLGIFEIATTRSNGFDTKVC
jgi:hypothetical protein